MPRWPTTGIFSMAIASLSEFRELLAQTRLVPADELSAVLDAAPTEDPRALAKTLVARQILTRWQAEQLWAGRRQFLLGKYRLLDKLGQGGMGAVYRARQNSTGRTVAIKVMAASLLDNADSVARFHREVQSAAALNHPNIVAAYDAGEADGAHYLVMEHVPGRDLSDWLKSRGRLPIDWACECIRQAALGLQHAHERGLVHRDIKPGNLLVVGEQTDEMPRVKILDMGLARLASEKGAAGELTQTGQILGTPDYIAPEQAKSTKTADIRADIFSLGCTLFKLLTGEVPFPGETLMEKLMARASEDAPLVSTLRPEVPPELAAVLARMLARQVTRRYQLPREVAEALAPFALGAADRLPAHDDEPSTRSGASDPSDESSSAVLRSFLGNLGESDPSENSPVGLTSPTGGVTTAAVAVRTRPETRIATEPDDQPVAARRFELAHPPAPRRGPSTAIWAAGAAGLAVALCVVAWKVLPESTPERLAHKASASKTPAPGTSASVTPAVSGPTNPRPASPVAASGTAFQPTDGRFGQGVRLAGKSMLSVAHRSELEPKALTLEVWSWLDEIPSGKDPRRWIVNKNTKEHEAGYFGLLIETDRIVALVNIGGGPDGIVRARGEPGAIKTGRWQHLAMTCSDNSLNIWCDGKLAATQSLARPRPTGARPLVIGCRADEYGWFQGKLDEVRLFDRALSAEELRHHAACDAAGAWREMNVGLIEGWSFDPSAP